MEASEWREIESVFAAAVELPEAEWEGFLGRACDGRVELLSELRSLLAAHRRGSGFLEAKPDRVGPYRLLEEIGHGGMGRVYRAERADGQFEQQVAVKLLSHVAGSVLSHRFTAERQILANLSHPNIARLLDGGESEFGIAYIAMELVEGVPVDEYVRDKSTAARLRLFREICDAVHYAHQNLVVHRDLKPANILVMADGTPKLLDFGIAKILAPDGRNQTVAPSLTPGYASPEQVRGEAVTTTSDVYSLGVLLRELLTGQGPDAAAASTGSRDLDAVIARAMREEPRARYASAEALATDLGRYLGHRPVDARRRAFWYVVSKFIARNRAAVGVTCAAAVAIAIAMTITVRQSRIAHRRFEDVRHLASSSLFEIHNAVAALPGSTPARKLIVMNALQALDRLSRDVSGDTGLQLELAQAYGRLGDVQGLISDANLGDVEGARLSYEKAGGLLAEVLRRDRSNDLAVRGMVSLKRAQTVVLLSLRRREEARRAAEEAVRMAEDRSRRLPGEQSDSLLAGAYGTMADATGEDLTYRYKAMETFERLLAANPRDPQNRRNVALVHKTIASNLVQTIHGEKALPHLRRAEELDAGRLKEAPDNRQAQMDLSFDYSQNATYYSNRMRFDEALGNYRKSLEIRQTLAASDPADARMIDRMAFLQVRIGNTLGSMKRHREAMEAYQAALRLSQALAAKDPGHPGYRSNIAVAQMAVATSALNLGKSVMACANWQAALDVFRDLEAKGRLREEEKVRMQEGVARFRVCSP